jgi:uncharacterized protein (TIGR02598 family)
MRAPGLHRGFSLIEIVLAIGVMSFAIIAILGLLSISFSSSKGSVDESLISAMARQVVASLQQQRFSGNTLFTNVTSGSDSKVLTNYFDANGEILTGSTGALYQCDVTAQAVAKGQRGDTNGLGPDPEVAPTAPCLLDLKLKFSWPVTAITPTTAPSTFTLYTSLAKYY